MTSTPLVAWAVAPEWVTLHQAAELMGTSYTAQDIAALIADGAIEAEEIGGAWLVELLSLSEYRDALWEVLTYEQ